MFEINLTENTPEYILINFHDADGNVITSAPNIAALNKIGLIYKPGGYFRFNGGIHESSWYWKENLLMIDIDNGDIVLLVKFIGQHGTLKNAGHIHKTDGVVYEFKNQNAEPQVTRPQYLTCNEIKWFLKY